MSKMSKAIAVLGVVAGLGVAALPLSTYAETAVGTVVDDFGTAYTQSATAQVQVEVGGAISIATSIGSETPKDNTLKKVILPELMPGGMVEATAENILNVQVTSNGKDATYSLYMNGLDNKTDMIGQKTGDTIPTLSAGDSLEKGTSAWGYKMDSDSEYAAIPAKATAIVGSKALTKPSDDNTTADVDTHTFKFGAAASTTQTPDTYVGTVVFTAVLEG